MKTLHYLLASTIAILFGLLVYSFLGMKDDPEVKELEKQLEQRRHQVVLQQRQSEEVAKASVPSSTSDDEMERMKKELEIKEAALKEIEMQNDLAAKEEALKIQEGALVDNRRIESKDQDLRRAKMIANALQIGRVMECIEDENGGFVTLELMMAENVQIGTELAIRRQSGILGKVKVTDITSEGAIANILPGMGVEKPVSGDELILPPPY